MSRDRHLAYVRLVVGLVNDKSSPGDEIPERDVTYIVLSIYLPTYIDR